jgi:hypothetical protein
MIQRTFPSLAFLKPRGYFWGISLLDDKAIEIPLFVLEIANNPVRKDFCIEYRLWQ